jgi:cytosine/adenosine deaminase-related metal-dependent hydrolase
VETNDVIDIRVVDGKIYNADDFQSDDHEAHILHFENAIAFPGLINSHDHLDFNLFPQLGNRLYNNYVEWGHDIHESNKDIINKVAKIPIGLRVKWGVYKNLINGVTTVVNHGELLNEDDNLITVFEKYHFIHSIQFQKDWRYKLNRPLVTKQPFVIHIGEGVDAGSADEIQLLTKWNLFKRDLIGVHGIAMNERQATHFKGVVWCPASNYFMTGRTAQVDHLKNSTKIVFGTDSALSATWNLWDHIVMIRNKQFATDKEIFEMLTSAPADLWQFNDRGKLDSGRRADIVIARKSNNQDGLRSFHSVTPESILMVLHKGEIKLFDAELLPQLNNQHLPLNNFSRIYIDGSCKYVYGNLPELIDQVHSHCPEVNFPIETDNNR